MSFNLNRINPNQTQIFFHDGRFRNIDERGTRRIFAPNGN